jgi:integrin-linked kinase-associated serine/threonine phosphatase 2C
MEGSKNEQPVAKRLKLAAAGTPGATKHFQLDIAEHGSRGRRKTMEDKHLVWSDEEIHKQHPSLPSRTRFIFCAIYDGHGGSCTVGYVREHLHENIASCMVDILDKEYPDQLAEAENKRAKLLNKTEVVKAAILQGFQKTEEGVEQEGAKNGWKDGSCAVMLIIVNNIVYVANLGDSKAVLCRRKQKAASLSDAATSGSSTDGFSFKSTVSIFAANAIKCAPLVDAKGLTKDHTCRQVSEKQRILKAGGRIENGRINGVMQVSRSFGDLALKKFGVSAEPDLGVLFKLTERDEFVILGCDGLWERYNKDMAVRFIRERSIAHQTFLAHPELHTSDCIYPEQHWGLKKACCAIVDDAINDKGGQDNTSVLVVRVIPLAA